MRHSVWCVDDNETMADSLKALLIASGIPAVAFRGGKQALDVLRSGVEPAVMLLDLMMPDNGTSLMRQIVDNPQWSFPIVVFSGAPDVLPKEYRGRAFKVLTKGSSPDELVRTIRMALGQRS